MKHVYGRSRRDSYKSQDGEKGCFSPPAVSLENVSIILSNSSPSATSNGAENNAPEQHQQAETSAPPDTCNINVTDGLCF